MLSKYFHLFQPSCEKHRDDNDLKLVKNWIITTKQKIMQIKHKWNYRWIVYEKFCAFPPQVFQSLFYVDLLLTVDYFLLLFHLFSFCIAPYAYSVSILQNISAIWWCCFVWSCVLWFVACSRQIDIKWPKLNELFVFEIAIQFGDMMHARRFKWKHTY